MENYDKTINIIKSVGIIASTIASILYIMILFPQLNPEIKGLIILFLPFIIALIILLLVLYVLIKLATTITKKQVENKSIQKKISFSENPIEFIKKELADDEISYNSE